MPTRRRPLPIPELFLGLLALAVAAVICVDNVNATIHEARHARDTVSVTGSARKPISSNLVRWSLRVSHQSPKAAEAARRLRGEVATVRQFLERQGIPAATINPGVVYAEQQVAVLPHHRRRISYRVSQSLNVSTHKLDVVEQAATRVGLLIAQGIDVSAEQPAYISTELTKAKLDALAAATADVRQRAEILVKGLGGKLGPMRRTQLGVYQITPRDSTEISDYGINDTTSREKDVNAVVTATFAVKR